MMNLIVEELYDKFSGQLKRYALSLCRNSEEADDLVQETFARAVIHAALLEILPEYKQRAWLYTVLKNYFTDIKRKQKFEICVDEIFEGTYSFDADSEMNANDLLMQVPEKFRDIIYKKFWLGMSSVEIAKELSIPAATVRFRVHTAIGSLRRKLKLRKEGK